ncbi:iron response transcriptional regulator IrrA [Sneathiella sp. HT1-7]|jgi:Fur family iron response transcriptional regulator|uniref:iron response transcriptional regulator IrrA n=1 Tax=Sneathiella sp. HT1-7 TaxID=2887192 RepID=UPI001D1545E3|nr:Fur family transcriptional regulator [Sneathiella sp. HT1-7]MCC3303793.1 transcriptional repressor [Sneathiella sp. HT1-7]
MVQSELMDLEKKLRDAQLRPTKQRLVLAQLLFSDGNRHITAERLHNDAMGANVAISLATIYNNLHQFTAAGLLREVVVDSSRSYFDTNVTPHHHFFHEQSGTLEDIAKNDLKVDNIPPLPDGTEISSVDVIVRVSSTQK